MHMRRVLVYGAGEAGEMVLSEIKRHPEEKIGVFGLVDDDPLKAGKLVQGVKVLGGRKKLVGCIRSFDINEVIITMPSISKQVIKDIVKVCKAEKVKLLIVPSTKEIIEGTVRFEQIKSLDLVDLLDREEIRIDSDRIRRFIEGKTILVTGAAGSIGSALTHRLLRYNPGEIVALDINENGLFYLSQRMGDAVRALGGGGSCDGGTCGVSGAGDKEVSDGDSDRREKTGIGNTRFIPCVADIKDPTILKEIFTDYEPEIVFHAAAYKHVPLMESHQRVVVLNNVLGTRNLLEISERSGVEKFIGISTDKAVNPISLMGKTKRVCELMVRAYAERGLSSCSVRFGNVLGSNGSVITVFQEQIRRGGPLTITSPGMERYFMTIQEATSLVLQAGSFGGEGNIYVLDMGKPIRIKELAENLIILSGLTPGVDVKINYIGMRDGEKLSEELFHDGAEVLESDHRGIFIERPALYCRHVMDDVQLLAESIYQLSSDEMLEVIGGILRSEHCKSPYREAPSKAYSKKY